MDPRLREDDGSPFSDDEAVVLAQAGTHVCV